MAGNPRAPRDGERVMVTCWCEQDVVFLPVEKVRAGETASCKLPDCQPPKEPT